MDQPTVSLKHWPSDEPDKESLPFLISRVIEQRGGFRNVTEDSLKAEIEAVESTSQDENEEDEIAVSGDDAVDAQPDREQILAARDQLAQHAMQALTDSSHALDFISLLLSRHNPKQAVSSLSPFIKANLPLGSLAAEYVQSLQGTEAKTKEDTDNSFNEDDSTENDENLTYGLDKKAKRKIKITVDEDMLVSAGLKSKSMGAAADAILSSARRLENEMKQEAEYWKQVLAIQSEGWPICRMPREKQTLALRYDFAEAAPEFREKSLMALRRGEGGDIDFSSGRNLDSPKALRVRLLCRGRTSAVAPEGIINPDGDDSTESLIARARDSIFDMELYHEIYREARSLTNRGVKCLSDGISLALGDEKSILIELVDGTGVEMGEPVEDISESYKKLPHLILTALRILLLHSHRLKYDRRSKPPPPLTEGKQGRFSTPIIRPILCHLQHRSTLGRVENFLGDVSATLSDAAVDFEVESPPDDFGLGDLTSSSKDPGTAPFVQELVSALCNPLQTSRKVDAPLLRVSFTITLRTHALGTEYLIKMGDKTPRSEAEQHLEDMSFSTLPEMEDCVLHIIQLGLVYEIHSRIQGKWEASSPHTGELTTEETSQGTCQVLRVSLSRHSMSLFWQAAIDNDDVEEQMTWTKSGDAASASNGLFETIEDLGRRTAPA